MIGLSKGLKELSRELNIPIERNDKLADIKDKLLKHPGFAIKSKLEILAKKYGVKITFNPKFHCEMNPIESLWAHLKWFIRKYTNQTFPSMKELLLSAR